MGSVKDAMMEREDDLAYAASILVDVGTLERCNWHETLIDGDGDLTEAYKAANARISAGKIKLREGQTRRDFTDLLKDAYEANCADACYSCEKIKAE